MPWRDRGRERDGLDCYGLARLAYRDCLRIDLPAFADGYETRADREAIAAIIAGERSRWREVESGQELPFDLVLMSLGGVPQHVGVVVEPGRLLHIAPESYSVIESYRQTRFRRRIVGFFRYANDGPARAD